MLITSFFSTKQQSYFSRELLVEINRNVSHTVDAVIFFFKSAVLLWFFSNSHETWHTWPMCQYAHCGTDFRKF